MFQFHFGQVCIYMGHSAGEHARLCRLLEASGIWYDVAEGDWRADAARRRAGLGERPDCPRLYRIYVRQRDAGLARHLIRSTAENHTENVKTI